MRRDINRDRFFAAYQEREDTIAVKRSYIDMAGDLHAGILLSQIMYWNQPSSKGNEDKLCVEHEGHKWLAKGRADWWDECRISPKQFDRAVAILEEKKLVFTTVKKFAGSPTKHIRINWEGLSAIYDSYIACPQGVNSIFHKGQYPNSPKVNNDIPQRSTSLTENTTQTTNKEIPKRGEESLRSPGRAPNVENDIALSSKPELTLTPVIKPARVFPPDEPAKTNVVEHIIWRVEILNGCLMTNTAKIKSAEAIKSMVEACYTEDQIIEHYVERCAARGAYTLAYLEADIPDLAAHAKAQAGPVPRNTQNAVPASLREEAEAIIASTSDSFRALFEDASQTGRAAGKRSECRLCIAG